jgi:prealbumin domain-containing protein/PEP-CTERM motif-containing protein
MKGAGKMKAHVRTRNMAARTGVTARFALAVMLLCATTTVGHATSVSFSTDLSGDYLLIGMGPVNDYQGQPGIGQAVNVNNYELGANKAPTPSPSSFGTNTGGPGLLGNVPDIPLQALPVYSGICNGNVAITNPRGEFDLQNVGVYGDLGVQLAGPRNTTTSVASNSFFNDPNSYPNTFTPTGFTNPGVNNNTGGTGVGVNPGAADSTTRMDPTNWAGVTGGVNFVPLLTELAAARTAISGYAATATLNLSGSGGKIENTTRIDTFTAGLHIVDIDTDDNDFLLGNANWVIDGPAGTTVIFRVPSDQNFLISNGNILVGDGGIGLNNVLFFSDRQENGQHFNFSNTVLNGVAFWTLANEGGEISIDNAQGCTQLIADKIVLNDVRFCRCAFDPTPDPGDLRICKFLDDEADGSYDGDEDLLEGWSFLVTGPDDFSQEVVTGDNGCVSLTGLTPGEYTILETDARLTAPEPWLVTTGISQDATVIAGQETTVYFGNEPPPVGEKPLPEPSAIALIALGSLGLVVRRRR